MGFYEWLYQCNISQDDSSQNVIPRQVALATPRHFLEIQILEPHLRPNESEILQQSFF